MNDSRPLIAVAAGCLVDRRGDVLIAQRPVGKIAAGQWEFPGGKIEPGEAPLAALARELHEELGIDVVAARPLIRITHHYRDRSVRLDTWRVEAWTGTPHGRENQALAWAPPEALLRYPLLAADVPIVAALRLPTQYVFTPPQATAAQIIEELPSLPPGALLRLRLPQLSVDAYRRVAADVIAAAGPQSTRVIVDREPQLAAELGAAGWHAGSARLAQLHARPESTGFAIASCHDAAELAHARDLGFDAAVLGPVQPTPTHPGAPTLGWRAFVAQVADANLPVYAIGGVGPADLETAIAAYAQGVAGISAWWPRATARSTAAGS